MGFGYFAWDNRCTRKTFFGIASSLLASLSSQVYPRCRESNRIASKNRIESKEKSFEKRSHFRFHSTDFISYPQVRIKTDDEALNERKNAIDDTHTSRRHYYLRNNLIEGGSFLSRWSVSVSHDDLRSLTLCGADTFYRDLIRLSSNPCKSFRVSELRTPNLGSSTLRI